METIRPEELFMSIDQGNLEYVLDDYGVYWYDYEKLIKMLYVTSNQAFKLYNYLDNSDKKIINVISRFKSNPQDKRFITTRAACDIINKQHSVGNDIIMKILKNESTHMNDYSDFNREIENIITFNDYGDVVHVCQSIRKLIETDVYKETMDKYDSNYDKEKEELLDLIRDEIYYYGDIDEVECKLKKKDKITEIKCIKNYESTCPSWIKDVVK
jgi:hypothetical protein